MLPVEPLTAKLLPHLFAIAPGLAIAVAAVDDLHLPSLDAVGSGAVLVGMALILYRIVLHATSRADAVYRAVIAQLEARNHELAAELTLERELRLALEAQGKVDRRRPPTRHSDERESDT